MVAGTTPEEQPGAMTRSGLKINKSARGGGGGGGDLGDR